MRSRFLAVALALASAVQVFAPPLALATVSSTTSSVAYSGNGSTTSFAVPFKFFASGDLTVTTTAPDGTITTLTSGINYTVTGAGKTAGGTVTTTQAPASGYTLTILRTPAFTQTTSFVNQGSFLPASHETALDKLTMQNQYLAYRVPVDGASKAYVQSYVAQQVTNGIDSTARTTATGSATARSFAERFNEVVNVRDFGADPTGATDSYAAILAAKNSCATINGGLGYCDIYFPRGYYRVSQEIPINTDGLKLRIRGAGAFMTAVEHYENNKTKAAFRFSNHQVSLGTGQTVAGNPTFTQIDDIAIGSTYGEAVAISGQNWRMRNVWLFSAGVGANAFLDIYSGGVIEINNVRIGGGNVGGTGGADWFAFHSQLTQNYAKTCILGNNSSTYLVTEVHATNVQCHASTETDYGVRFATTAASLGAMFDMTFNDCQFKIIYDGPTYSSGTTYSKDQHVTYSGTVYRSLVDSNVNHTPNVSPTQWSTAANRASYYLDGAQANWANSYSEESGSVLPNFAVLKGTYAPGTYTMSETIGNNGDLHIDGANSQVNVTLLASSFNKVVLDGGANYSLTSYGGLFAAAPAGNVTLKGDHNYIFTVPGNTLTTLGPEFTAGDGISSTLATFPLHAGSSSPGSITIKRARGTLTAPTASAAADDLGQFTAYGYVNGGFEQGGYVRISAPCVNNDPPGNCSANHLSGKVAVAVNDGTGSQAEAANFTATTVTLLSGDPIKGSRSYSTTWDPANLAADGDTTQKTVTTTGTTVDGTWTCTASLSTLTTQSVLVSCSPSASGQSVVTIMNKTGGALDLASGTLRVDAWKH